MMGLSINEAQTVCAALMGLITLLLVFLQPGKMKSDGTYRRAGGVLACGTALLTIHFFLQYSLHKPLQLSVGQRALINLLFCIPASLCINLSLLLLQKNGRLRRYEWLIPWGAYLLAVGIWGICRLLPSDSAFSTGPEGGFGLAVLAVVYAFTLIFSTTLQFRCYLQIRAAIRQGRMTALRTLNRWSRWFIFLMGLVGFGLPVMFFSDNLLYRAIYLLLTIFIVFFYIYCFIVFGMGAEKADEAEHSPEAGAALHTVEIHTAPAEEGQNGKKWTFLSPAERQRIGAAVERWVEHRGYLHAGLSVKEVAHQIGISREQLNLWVTGTDHRPFNHWLNALRIEEAKKLMLLHPDWSNEAIARACGFSDRCYFQRLFRESVGTTPSKWVEENLQQCSKTD